MRRIAAWCLVLLVVTPSHAQKPLKTIGPDDAYANRNKQVKVCGVVRQASIDAVEGRIYFVAKNDERVWARGKALAPFASRVTELPGATMCAHGRVYSNLEGVGIDIGEEAANVELISVRAAETTTPTPLPTFVPPSFEKPEKKPKKPFPWDAVITASVVGSLAVASAMAGGTTYSAPSSNHAPVTVTTAPSNLWIESVSRNGEVIVLSDGTVWSVDWRDQLHTALWLPISRVTLAPGSRYGESVMVNLGARPETAVVTQVR